MLSYLFILAGHVRHANCKAFIYFMFVCSREEYDKAINSVQISVVYSDLYEYRSCALHKKPTIDVSPCRLSIDRRRSVADLKTLIMKVRQIFVSQQNTLYDSMGHGVAEYRSCALHKKPTIDVSPFRLSIDRRRSVADLKTLIMKVRQTFVSLQNTIFDSLSQ